MKDETDDYIALIYNAEEMDGLYVDELSRVVEDRDLDVETFSGPNVPEELRNRVEEGDYPTVAIMDRFNPQFSTTDVMNFLSGEEPDTEIIGIVADDDKRSSEFREHTTDYIIGNYTSNELMSAVEDVLK